MNFIWHGLSKTYYNSFSTEFTIFTDNEDIDGQPRYVLYFQFSLFKYELCFELHIK